MRFLLYTLLTSVFISCYSGNNTDVLSFKTGAFKTYLGQRKDSSSFYRTEKLQIESYRNKIDTFDIHWKSNFEYELRKVNPQSKLDSIPFVVKIIAIKESSYQFKGAYLGSNFKQEGTTYKISRE